MITTKEAKELTLEVWRYLREHPEIFNKAALPLYILVKVDLFKHRCPLCEIYMSNDCVGCPLGSCIKPSIYSAWIAAGSTEQRQQAAAKIVELVEAWEVEHE